MTAIAATEAPRLTPRKEEEEVEQEHAIKNVVTESLTGSVSSSDSSHLGLPLDETGYHHDAATGASKGAPPRSSHSKEEADDDAADQLGSGDSRQDEGDAAGEVRPQHVTIIENENDASEETATNKRDHAVVALEERVQDLETKLLVLSRMLQLQRASSTESVRRPSSSEFPGGGGGGMAFRPSLEVAQSSSAESDTVTSLPSMFEQPDPSTTRMKRESSNVGVNDNDDEKDDGSRTPPLQIQTNSTLLYAKRSKDTGSAAFPHLESPAAGLGMVDDPSSHSSFNAAPLNGSNDNNDDNSALVTPPDINSSEREKGQKSDSLASSSAESRGANKAGEKFSIPFPKQEEEEEAPPPSSPPRRRLSMSMRNLSFKLLYGGDEEAYEELKQTDPSATASLTPSEGKSLGIAFLRKRQEQKQQREQEKQQRHQQAAEPNVPDEKVRSKWLNYLNSFQESTHDVDLQMEEFVKVPSHVESIMAFGFYICVDSLLYIVTILPIRFIWSLLLLILRVFYWKRPSQPFQFHRRHTYQMIQVFLLYVIYQYVLAPISIGKVYHWIRGQAMIKLYVLIAMVEVFDRLMCSLGQDCLDSMYWNAVNRPRSSRMLISVAVVLLYATCHTLLLFLHVATLNVAMNSADHALLTLFISGNFAEIKSTVFKKYNKPALFKLTASDICERFKLGLFLGLVLLLNVCQGMDAGQFMDYVRVCAIVWCAELLADWIKHAFITKFNMLPAKVYIEYALLLAGDFTGIGHEGVNLDNSHAVVKRIGFAQLPLVCCMFRLLREAAKYAMLNFENRWNGWICMFAVWLFLLAAKVALGSLLQHISLQKLRQAPEILPSGTATPTSSKKKK